MGWWPHSGVACRRAECKPGPMPFIHSLTQKVLSKQDPEQALSEDWGSCIRRGSSLQEPRLKVLTSPGVAHPVGDHN